MQTCPSARSGLGGEKQNPWGWCGRTSVARSLGPVDCAFGERGAEPLGFPTMMGRCGHSRRRGSVKQPKAGCSEGKAFPTLIGTIIQQDYRLDTANQRPAIRPEFEQNLSVFIRRICFCFDRILHAGTWGSHYQSNARRFISKR